MKDQTPPKTYETKAEQVGYDTEINSAFDQFMNAFDEFKQTNDTRLNELEQKASVDVLTEEKLNRLNQALEDNQNQIDSLLLKSSRPSLNGDRNSSPLVTKHHAAFNNYMRKGDANKLREIETKALSITSDPDGGYLIPDETEKAVMSSLKEVSPIRSIAGVRQVSGTVYKKPFSITGPGTGWVGETAARPETTSPTLAELSFPTMELYAMPAATSNLLDDSAVNIDEWIAEEVQSAFAEQETAAFVNGDGVNKPQGFLNYTSVDESSWSWGESLTVWGTIVTALSTILPIIGPFIGLDISAELIQQFGDTVAKLIQIIGGITGTSMALYGRARASTKLTRRSMEVKV